MNVNQQGPMENLLDGLSQHSKFLPDDELKSELQARGVDVERFLLKAREIAAIHLKEERLSWMKVADEKKRQMDATANITNSWLGKSELAIAEAWKRFLTTIAPKQALAFRNKTDLSIEDMARILDDFERLRLRNEGNNSK